MGFLEMRGTRTAANWVQNPKQSCERQRDDVEIKRNETEEEIKIFVETARILLAKLTWLLDVGKAY